MHGCIRTHLVSPSNGPTANGTIAPWLPAGNGNGGWVVLFFHRVLAGEAGDAEDCIIPYTLFRSFIGEGQDNDKQGSDTLWSLEACICRSLDWSNDDADNDDDEEEEEDDDDDDDAH
ncbi:hypothetical protein MMC22_010648 [Lobaria immixta]|nr:hypothetical protein [Lobaria immixta]